MLTRPLSVCLLTILASASWTADAASKTTPDTATSTWTRTPAPFSGSPCVTNRTVRPVARPAVSAPAHPPVVSKSTSTWVRKSPAPLPPKTPLVKAVPKPVQGSLQLHPPSTGAVVRTDPVRVELPPFRLLVAKPAAPPASAPPRSEPSVSSDFKFGPKGLSRQIDPDWSMSFSAALSPSPSAQSHSASQWDRVMPVIKLEKKF